MSACSDVPFMLALSWRPGTRHCICQPDRTRAAPSLKEPFICGGGAERGEEVRNVTLWRSQWGAPSLTTALCWDSHSSPVSQQALEASGCHQKPFSRLQADGGWGVRVEGV